MPLRDICSRPSRLAIDNRICYAQKNSDGGVSRYPAGIDAEGKIGKSFLRLT
jgi:hypothetical protein